MIALFTLLRRSQHAAAAADDSAQVVLFDLYIALPTETQARHVTMTESPLEASRLVGELGQPVSKDKLTMASKQPEIVQAGAVGAREQGQSVSSDNTNTRIEMIDTGEVEIVSDENDSKIFNFSGKKLIGRMMMTRDPGTSRFNMTIDSNGGDNSIISDNGNGNGNNNNIIDDKKPKEDTKKDPEPLSVDDFISPEFAEVINELINQNIHISDDVKERLTAISHRLSDKKLTNRDVIFVLKFISGGETAALNSIESTTDTISLSLWDTSDKKNEIIYLDQETGDQYRLVPSEKNDGTFTIPRFQFISEGMYNDELFDSKKVAKIISNFAELSKTKILDVPAKIGHHRSQSLLGNTGELAHGWVNNVWGEETANGTKGFLSLEGIPQTLAYLISKKALKNRSAEIFKNVNYNGKDYGPTLKAISFLGASTPAVLGMQPDASGAVVLNSAVQMYTQEDGSKVIIVKPNGGKTVSDAKKTIEISVDDLNKRISDAVQDAMERAKKIAEVDSKKMSDQVVELSAKLKNEQDSRRKDLVKSNKATNESEFDSLVKNGSILPVQKDDFISLCKIIDGVNDMAMGRDLSDMLSTVKCDKDTLEFSVETMEADKKVEIKVPLKNLFFRFVKGIKQIDLSRQTNDGKTSTKNPVDKKVLTKSDEIDELTRKLMKDSNLQYAEAFIKAYDLKFVGDAGIDAAIDGATSVPSTSDSE